ncbi:MAG: pullulanase [Candidatus Marinimicrobia bacterium]|nr:pullulanase [Candidatus Neomarinimicrobiota bacterium]
MNIKNSYLSYGAFVSENSTTFKIHAPKSAHVFLVIFDSPEDEKGKEFKMKKTEDGDFTLKLENVGTGTYYGYRLEGPLNDPKVLIADPYTKAAVTQNSMRHVAKSLIIDDKFDWGNDTWIKIDPRDLIIYEMHVRDMTTHPTSTAKQKGTYLGLVEPNQNGGIKHIKSMGVNAVQLLPIQEFANVEVPYKDKTAPVYNDWNPYSRNHWGYMTTFFFAPESYYATDGTNTSDAWNGTDGRAVNEFKDMVKSFHNEEIAVIMDVVYNHVSNYDWHPLKYLDRESYFRLDDSGNYITHSGCGNDTQSENPKMRQLILESLKYWMMEFHVDGFRFDIGNLIDEETRQLIIDDLKFINPNVIILAEPWGNGYDPHGFSDMGWASFNDQFRDGLKGSTWDINDKGFLLGQLRDGDDQKFLQRLVMGSLREYGGQYVKSTHSVNYLECHDDYTFGDRLRITGGFIGKNDIISDLEKNALVKGDLLKMNKLGVLFLFTSQGIVFIHEGQEWARSKVIASSNAPDDHVGIIDHNSYEKDNETNWLNWNERDMNSELVDYYKGLIELRKQYFEFRHSKPDDFEFMNVGKNVAVAYILKDKFFVALNGVNKKSLELDLPSGQWKILVDEETVYLENQRSISGSITVPASTGLVLIRN